MAQSADDEGGTGHNDHQDTDLEHGKLRLA
jgi:hypothetical protein